MCSGWDSWCKEKQYETWFVCGDVIKGIADNSVSQKERRKHDLASIHFSEPVCNWDGYWGQLDWKQEG